MTICFFGSELMCYQECVCGIFIEHLQLCMPAIGWVVLLKWYFFLYTDERWNRRNQSNLTSISILWVKLHCPFSEVILYWLRYIRGWSVSCTQKECNWGFYSVAIWTMDKRHVLKIWRLGSVRSVKVTIINCLWIWGTSACVETV